MSCLHKIVTTRKKPAAQARRGPFAELEALADDDACLDWLRERLHPDGSGCPRCARPTRFHRVRGRAAYSCQYCGHQVYPTAGTVFRRSTTPLSLWFRAVRLAAAAPAPPTPAELAAELGVAARTAARILERIGPAVAAGEPALLLSPPPDTAAGADGDDELVLTTRPPAFVVAELGASLPALRGELAAAVRRRDEAGREAARLQSTIRKIEVLTARRPEGTGGDAGGEGPEARPGRPSSSPASAE